MMFGYFCIGVIDFKSKGKKFIRVYKFILSYIKRMAMNLNNLECNVMFAINIEYFIVYIKCGHEYGKIFKEEESIKILKFF